MDAIRRTFTENGWLVVPGLFSAEETARFRAHYHEMLGRETPAHERLDLPEGDPLRAYPRLLQPHRFDPLSLDFLLDARFRQIFSRITNVEPLAVQTMLYFKPPGARGQALHQDNRYLDVKPGTCLAAWLALDDCDAENGAMQVVPGSHRLRLLCDDLPADPDDSWSGVTVGVPEGMTPVTVEMRAGDVLFFDGQLIHGSGRNRSSDRFRRTLIAHYIEGDATQVADYYHPVYRWDGSVVKDGLASGSMGGGPCGSVSLRPDGSYDYTLRGELAAAKAAH